MKIISHRGYWTKPAEKNAPAAFRRSFDLGFGTETDVRDAGGALVISHDPPSGGELTLDDLVDMAITTGLPLALNIKADGLAGAISEVMSRKAYPHWFVFDMSIPDTRTQFAAGNPVYMRVSEFEPDPPFLDQAAGIWLDAFEKDDWRINAIGSYLDRDLAVCLVSPELHRREHLPFWKHLAQSDVVNDSRLMLCTDLPEDAVDFFAGRNND